MAGKNTPTVSFADNISPYFQRYVGNMRWRFDLTDYEQVKANADQIYGRILNKTMPPPPFEPFTEEFIASFKIWINQDFPP